MKGRIAELSDGRSVWLGKTEEGYYMQFSRPVAEEDERPTCISTVKEGKTITSIGLSHEAMETLINLYTVYDKENESISDLREVLYTMYAIEQKDE